MACVWVSKDGDFWLTFNCPRMWAHARCCPVISITYGALNFAFPFLISLKFLLCCDKSSSTKVKSFSKSTRRWVVNCCVKAVVLAPTLVEQHLQCYLCISSRFLALSVKKTATISCTFGLWAGEASPNSSVSYLGMFAANDRRNVCCLRCDTAAWVLVNGALFFCILLLCT